MGAFTLVDYELLIDESNKGNWSRSKQWMERSLIGRSRGHEVQVLSLHATPSIVGNSLSLCLDVALNM
jgi:hypothetical protein